jgi:hypothetical protein
MLLGVCSRGVAVAVRKGGAESRKRVGCEKAVHRQQTCRVSSRGLRSDLIHLVLRNWVQRILVPWLKWRL